MENNNPYKRMKDLIRKHEEGESLHIASLKKIDKFKIDVNNMEQEYKTLFAFKYGKIQMTKKIKSIQSRFNRSKNYRNGYQYFLEINNLI